MKKVLKGMILVLILIISFSIPKVMAADDKTIVVELPSNETNMEDLLFILTTRQAVILSTITGGLYGVGNGTYINNQQGKPIIRVNTYVNNNIVSNISYELLDDVTEEDCTYIINDEMRNYLNENMISDVFDGYDKIKLEVKEIEHTNNNNLGESLILDYSKNDPYDTKYIDNMLFMTLIQTLNIDNLGAKLTLYNPDNKELVSFFQEEQINVVIPDNVTEEDDIIIELTDDERDRIARFLSYSNKVVDLDDYSRIVIKFSDKEYLNSDYIVDIKTITFAQNDEKSSILNVYMSTRGVLDNERLNYYLKNNNNKIILNYNQVNENIYIAISTSIATYKDNIMVDLNDRTKAKLQEVFGDNVPQQIVIKLKDPEFIKGQNQVSNKTDNMTFILTINKNELEENGSIYIDGNLLDKDKYVLGASKDGVEVILNKEYINTLSAGNHEIKVKALYGEVASVFKVETEVKNPNTGSTILLITLLMLTSLSIIIKLFKERNQVI